MKEIRVLIADDHALIRDGLNKIISLDDDRNITIVGEASNGEEAVSLARELNPDVILMDINMPVINGIEASKTIKKSYPDIRIIILTIHDTKEYIYELMNLGVSGYVLKDTSSEELLRVIGKVAAGETYIDPRMTGKLMGEWRRQTATKSIKDSLSERELEVLTEIARGASNQVIAGKLFLSEKTIKNHITNIFRKLDVNDRTQAAIFAIKHNLVDE